jgi:hypothetical protein
LVALLLVLVRISVDLVEIHLREVDLRELAIQAHVYIGYLCNRGNLETEPKGDSPGETTRNPLARLTAVRRLHKCSCTDTGFRPERRRGRQAEMP